ncbi:hypothetical protein FKW77_001367 [Venturia effusa]|uniref:AB hydrolase-1 domain-containing protein n=1 Tax=Venturia effusa TaxID=50376 RepID=A0A517LI37_9PEZI|nr:hypothetical protein FKW77_001367 [Venturia effusa]
MSIYPNAFPSTITPEVKEFMEEYFHVSNAASTHTTHDADEERFASLFVEDGTYEFAEKAYKGHKEISDFREFLFNNVPHRDHPAIQFYTFGDDDLQLMCIGKVEYKYEDGTKHECEWAGRYEIVKLSKGALKFKRVQIITILVLFIPVLCVAAAVPSKPNCFDLDVPVHVESQSYPLLVPVFKNGYEATEFVLQATKRDVNPDSSALLGKPVNVSTIFSIGATYCTPSQPSTKSSTLQLLSHGLGFDRSYWDLDGDLNYIAAATSAGYSTFSYDRLGNGASTIADPYNTVQTVIELAILTEITSLLRNGNVSKRIPIPKKIVHVGQSYGSSITNALAATSPEISDAIVLTGYSLNATYEPWFLRASAFHLASENQPERFSGLSSGYLTWGDKFTNQYGFLKYPYFDPKVLDKAEAGKFPFTLGEILTGGLIPVAAPGFEKPVLLMAADADLIFCGSDCYGVVDGPYAANAKVFSAAKPLKTYIQPNTGHGMNLHFNATGWYGVVQDFLAENGL